jgi:3-hydroxyisobutyrate dehydrogenase-like beta-hydroxyacid dehydrogenase
MSERSAQILSKTVAFVGLGQMGRLIALNLVKGGVHVTVCNRSDSAFAEFIRRGAEATTVPANLGMVDVVIVCLPDADVVRNTLFGANGIEPRRAGQLVIDLGTTDFAATLEIARVLASRGVAFLDAPVSGMEARARDGTLTVMCGGASDDFALAKPLFELMGDNILHMGAIGSGQLTKLINQLLFDINAAALAEILPMAVRMGLDPASVGAVVNSGTGRSYASEFFIERVLDNRFTDGYAMHKAYKDLVSGAEISAKHCIPMPVLAAATATYQMALLKGHGDKDKGGMIRVFEELLGVDYRREPSAISTRGGGAA